MYNQNTGKKSLFYNGRQPPQRTKLVAFRDYMNPMLWERMSACQTTALSHKLL